MSQQEAQDQTSKTLNCNSIYTYYKLDVTAAAAGHLNIFINPKSIFEHETEYGMFITTRPVAVIHQVDEETTAELDVQNVSFNIKPHWKTIIDNNSASYFVIVLNDQTKSFTSDDGSEHEFHEAKLMQITNEDLVKKLHERTLKNFKLEEFNQLIL